MFYGGYGDPTALSNNIYNFANRLEQYGFQRWGNEVMYNGISGEQLKTSIFIGPTYYQRLKIMVADKMYSRATGKMQNLIKQPAAGRSNQGGLKIGEMERDAILSHGVMKFMNESVMERSDKFKLKIDSTTGIQNYKNNNDSDNDTYVLLPHAKTFKKN